MSVRTDLRSTPRAIYMQKANELQAAVIEFISHLSKRYRGIVKDVLMPMTTEIIVYCGDTQKHYPVNKHNIDARHELFRRILDALDALSIVISSYYSEVCKNSYYRYTKTNGKRYENKGTADTKLDNAVDRIGKLIKEVEAILPAVVRG